MTLFESICVLFIVIIFREFNKISIQCDMAIWQLDKEAIGLS